MALLAIILLSSIHVIHVRGKNADERMKYEYEVSSLKKEIEVLNAKENTKNLLIDSLPLWRKRDQDAILQELEEIQDNIDYYSEVQGAKPKKVDKMYDKAIKELVAKYKNGGLKP
jgi:5,10-methylene-tetrahydrofolate dehydrogenase/methenyl tetrahydrofolate cyclohydrolase